jgi:putative ABC transport system permease protein
MGSEGMVVAMGGGGGSMDPASQVKLLTNQSLAEMAAIPGVVEVIPREWVQGGTYINYGKLEVYGGMVGLGTEDMASMGVTATQGSTRLAKGTVLVGGWLAKNFMDPRQYRPGMVPTPQAPDIFDQKLRITLVKYTEDGQEIRKSYNLKVAGILTEQRGEWDGMLVMTLSDVTAWNEWFRGQRINRNRDGFEMAVVKAADLEQVLEIADQINSMGYRAETPQRFVEGVNSFYQILQVIFGAIGAIALLVAAIGIANTMTMSILERTREIGLMKAIGATNRDVLSIFLGEASGIGLIGGVGGVLLGWLGGQLINVVATSYLAQQAVQSGGLPTSFSVYTPIWLILFTLIFSTLVGLVSGLYPALRAATLVPVNALKYE